MEWTFASPLFLCRPVPQADTSHLEQGRLGLLGAPEGQVCIFMRTDIYFCTSLLRPHALAWTKAGLLHAMLSLPTLMPMPGWWASAYLWL